MDLKKSSGNWLKLVTGTGLAQLLTFLVYPLYTRIFSPEDFGYFGIFSAASIVGATILTGRYELAIILPREDMRAGGLFTLSSIFILAGTVLSFILLLLLQFSELFDPVLMSWLIFLPVSLFLEGTKKALERVLNRKKLYSAISISKILQAGTTITTTVLLSDILFSKALLTGFITGQAAGAVILFFPGYKAIRSIITFKRKYLRVLARAYSDFPVYEMMSAGMNAVSRQLPFFILPLGFTTEIIGQFNLAFKVLAAPVGLLGTSVAQVFYQSSVRKKEQDPEAYFSDSIKMLRQLALLALLPALVIIFFGEYIFHWLFGPEWQMAGTISRVLIPWLFFVLLTIPFSHLLTVERKLKEHLFYNILLLSGRSLVLLTGVFILQEALLTLTIYSFTCVAFSLSLILYIRKLVKNQVRMKS